MRITLTYLEFYSGLGGWGYAVEHACRSIVKEVALSSPPNTGAAEGEALHHVDEFQLQARLLAAYDHSDLANSVFCHNHRIFRNSISRVDATSPLSLTPQTSFSNEKIDEKKKKKKRTKHSNEEQRSNRPRQTPIERLTLEELQYHSADIWCMSPPCQPHTRQHSNQHLESEDARSKSFLHLCKLLCDMKESTLPKLILLENVIGFEKEQTSCNNDGERINNKSEDCQNETSIDHNSAATRKSQVSGDQECNEGNDGASGSFRTLRRALSRQNYHVGHFQLDPTHVGIPNNRPRHYTVAIRRRQQYRPDFGGKGEEATGVYGQVATCTFSNTCKQPNGEHPPLLSLFQDISGRYEHLFSQELQLDTRPIIYDENALFTIGERAENVTPYSPILLSSLSSFLDHDLPPHVEGSAMSAKQKSLQIPEKIRTSSSAWCFDVATPTNNCITSCFTHSYGKFVRGTGSILYTGPLLFLEDKYNISANTTGYSAINRFQLKSPEDRVFDATWSKDLDWDQHMRYFSGSEIARLMGFPVEESPTTAVCKETVNADLSLVSDAKTGIGPESMVSLSDKSFRNFSFPPECTMKQQWKLLGNSLNVRVAAIVAEIGIQSLLPDFHVAETSSLMKSTILEDRLQNS